MSTRRQPEAGGMSGGRAAAWSLLIVAIGGAAWGVRYYFQADEAPVSRRVESAEPVVTPIEPPQTEPIDWVAWRAKSWARIEPRIAAAEREAAGAVDEEIRSVVEFFEQRRSGTRPFAEAVMSLKGKWVFVKSKLPTADDEAHLRFINEQFERHLFASGDLNRIVEQAVTVYVGRLQGIENRLLAEIRNELSEGMPGGARAPQFVLDDAAFRGEFDRRLAEVAAEIGRHTRGALSREAASLVAGEVATVIALRVAGAVATRLGISAGVLGAGAASSWATFGVGIVAAFVIDYVVDKVVAASGNDPVERVSQKVGDVLTEVRNLIVSGDPDARAALEKMRGMAENDPDAEVRRTCREAVERIEDGSHLGLRHDLDRLQEERGELRRAVLRRLVDGVGAET